MATSVLNNHTSTNAQKSSTEYLLDVQRNYLIGSWTSAAGRRGEQSTRIRAAILITRIALPPICIGSTHRIMWKLEHTPQSNLDARPRSVFVPMQDCSRAAKQSQLDAGYAQQTFRLVCGRPERHQRRARQPSPHPRLPLFHIHIHQYIDPVAGVLLPAKQRISLPPEQCSLQQQQRPGLQRIRPATYIHLHRPRQ